MTQTYEKIMKMRSPKIEQAEKIGDLNPRYFEEAMTPENALEKVRASTVSRYSVRPF